MSTSIINGLPLLDRPICLRMAFFLIGLRDKLTLPLTNRIGVLGISQSPAPLQGRLVAPSLIIAKPLEGNFGRLALVSPFQVATFFPDGFMEAPRIEAASMVYDWLKKAVSSPRKPGLSKSYG